MLLLMMGVNGKQLVKSSSSSSDDIDDSNEVACLDDSSTYPPLTLYLSISIPLCLSLLLSIHRRPLRLLVMRRELVGIRADLS